MPKNRTFEKWLSLVDARLLEVVNHTHDVMVDWAWYDAWEAGMTPRGAVNEYLQNEGYDDLMDTGEETDEN